MRPYRLMTSFRKNMNSRRQHKDSGGKLIMGQAYSLYTSTKILTFHHKIRITDEQGNTVYTAKSKFFTLHDNTNVYDASGKKVAHIRKKFFTCKNMRKYATMAS